MSSSSPPLLVLCLCGPQSHMLWYICSGVAAAKDYFPFLSICWLFCWLTDSLFDVQNWKTVKKMFFLSVHHSRRLTPLKPISLHLNYDEDWWPDPVHAGIGCSPQGWVSFIVNSQNLYMTLFRKQWQKKAFLKCQGTCWAVKWCQTLSPRFAPDSSSRTLT